MMPYCDIEGCEQVADKIFITDEEYAHVALCKKHNPESNRATRRKKIPSNPRFTKKRLAKRR